MIQKLRDLSWQAVVLVAVSGAVFVGALRFCPPELREYVFGPAGILLTLLALGAPLFRPGSRSSSTRPPPPPTAGES
mgnify:CR=1 FL=1